MKTIFPDRHGDHKVTLYRPKGCPECQGSGYWGRKGIYELLVMNESDP